MVFFTQSVSVMYGGKCIQAYVMYFSDLHLRQNDHLPK